MLNLWNQIHNFILWFVKVRTFGIPFYYGSGSATLVMKKHSLIESNEIKKFFGFLCPEQNISVSICIYSLYLQVKDQWF
jgi:hypothetical protein